MRPIRGMNLTTRRFLAHRLRMSGAITLFPPYSIMTWSRKTLPIPTFGRFYQFMGLGKKKLINPKSLKLVISGQFLIRASHIEFYKKIC